MSSSSQPQLLLIGLGVIVPDHITAQATRALSRCTHLYSIVQEPPGLWLPPGRAGQTEVVNLLHLYSEGSLRTENYDRAAEAILKAASNGRTIGYVTYGNPMAYDRVAQNLVSHAQGSGLEIEVVPGISSIDTIFCDLQIDVAPGVQIYEASWLVACQVLPRVDFPLLLLQIGTFGSLRTHYATRQDGSSLTELIEHLCKVYPRAQEISVVRSTGHEDRPARVRYVSLKNLSTVTAEDLSGASLYIPALERPHLNDQIVSEMTHN